MSNVFSIKEAENRNVLISMFAPGIKRFLKKGKRVKFRSDLEEGRYYNTLFFIAGGMASVKGKTCIIKQVHFEHNTITLLENAYSYSFEMLEGVYLN